MNFTDAELIHQTLNGNPEAFGRLVQRYQTAVYGFAFHLIGNFADAEDITQEAFIIAYEKLPQLIEPDKFATWLRRITANLCKMRLRGKKEFLSIEELDEEEMRGMYRLKSVTTPVEECVRKETTEIVMNAINSLPDKERLVVTLYYLDDLTCREIGDFLSVPQGTIKSWLHRARRQLKEKLIKVVQNTFIPKTENEEIRKQVLIAVTEALAEIAPKYGISKAYIFGSTVKEGSFQPESDVDIALFNLGNQHFPSIMSEMSQRLARNVDLYQIEKIEERKMGSIFD